MTIPLRRLDRDFCAQGFIRAAQYLANMLTSADVLAESRELIRSVFTPDVVCLCRRSCEVCDLPAEDREVIRPAVDQVFETGFMAMETFGGQSQGACAVLPINVRGRTEAALLIGYVGESAVPPHTLEALLSVAGMIGATLARQRADGEVVLLAQERAARAVAEVTERRSRLLSEVSKALFASFDYEATLPRVARLLVPQLADWCAVELCDRELAEDRPPHCVPGANPGMNLRAVAVAHADPSKRELASRLLARSGPNSPPARVAAAGLPELHADLADASLAAWARDAAHFQVARELGTASAMIVPMSAPGGVYGAITLAASQPDRRYGAEDLALAEEIGRRAGTAMENARLYAQAQQAIAVRDQFLAIASHELKTPLTALMLVIAGIERSLDKLPGAATAMRTKIAALSRQGHRLNQLVSNLLDVSRIQAGRLHVSIERVDLCALVREVVDRHEQEATGAGCPLEVVTREPVTGAWDQSRVDQVVSNLLSNAIKYGAGKPVSVVAEASGDTARFSVADRGIGIAPEDQERIFQRFERAVTSTGFAGMGLGLWISREIVTRLGGSIRVESRLGEGSRFTVELPMRPRATMQS